MWLSSSQQHVSGCGKVLGCTSRGKNRKRQNAHWVPPCFFIFLAGWNGEDPLGQAWKLYFKDGRTFVSLCACITDQGGPLLFTDWPVHMSSMSTGTRNKLVLSLTIVCVWVPVFSTYPTLNKFAWALAWDLKLQICWCNAFIHFSSLAAGDPSVVVQHAGVVKSSRADGSRGCKCVWRLSHPLLQGTSKPFSAIVSLVLPSHRACCLNSLLESVQWGAVEGSQNLYWFNSEAPWKSAITEIKPWSGWWDGICAWKYLNTRMFFISFRCTKQHSD